MSTAPRAMIAILDLLLGLASARGATKAMPVVVVCDSSIQTEVCRPDDRAVGRWPRNPATVRLARGEDRAARLELSL